MGGSRPARGADLARQTMLEERLKAEARRPFELALAPLWRALWITLTNTDHVLLFTLHHSIIDQWSMRLFFRELAIICRGRELTDPASLPDLPVQYADYACWQREKLTGEPLRRLRDYWKVQLADFPPRLELPTDRRRPPRPSGQGAIHEFRLEGPVIATLRELARAETSTLFNLTLAAFQVWLFRITGQPDVVVATPMASRERPEVQNVIGYFLNTLPIRTRLDRNASFREALRQVRQTIWGCALPRRVTVRPDCQTGIDGLSAGPGVSRSSHVCVAGRESLVPGPGSGPGTPFEGAHRDRQGRPLS